MTVDIDSVFASAQVLEDDELETAPRKPREAESKGGLAGQLVTGFAERGEDSLVVTGAQLGPRKVNENGARVEAPHNLTSLRNLAGQARKFARESGLEVNAKVVRVKETGEDAIRFTHDQPDYDPNRGRPRAEVASEVE